MLLTATCQVLLLFTLLDATQCSNDYDYVYNEGGVGYNWEHGKNSWDFYANNVDYLQVKDNYVYFDGVGHRLRGSCTGSKFRTLYSGCYGNTHLARGCFKKLRGYYYNDNAHILKGNNYWGRNNGYWNYYNNKTPVLRYSGRNLYYQGQKYTIGRNYANTFRDVWDGCCRNHGYQYCWGNYLNKHYYYPSNDRHNSYY